jgi:hypothetical protein
MAGTKSKRERIRIATDNRGNDQSDLGWKAVAGVRFKQHRFYLCSLLDCYSRFTIRPGWPTRHPDNVIRERRSH